MAVSVRTHFYGTNIVPDEPVDLPVNQPLELELKQSTAELVWDPEKAKAAGTCLCLLARIIHD